jgi:hypothetical protein
MWICPVCKFVSPAGGACPCSVKYDCEIILNHYQDQEKKMATAIEYTGNIERFAGQKKARLVSVEAPIAKTITSELRAHIGKDLPENSVRQFLLCHYIGEKGIAFADVIGYGGGRKLKLEKAIGTWFEIDVPVTAVKQVELDYGANDNSGFQEKSSVAEEMLQKPEIDTAGTDRSVGTGVPQETPAAILPVTAESGNDGQKTEAVVRREDREKL